MLFMTIDRDSVGSGQRKRLFWWESMLFLRKYFAICGDRI